MQGGGGTAGMCAYQVWLEEDLQERSLLVGEESVTLQGGSLPYEYRYSELRRWEQQAEDLVLLPRGADVLRLVAASEAEAELIVSHIGACTCVQSLSHVASLI